MSKLTAKTRAALPTAAFAGPGRSYPVPDRGHAIAAKSMAARYAPPAVKAAVDAKANRVLGHPHQNLGHFLHPRKSK